MYEVCMFIDHCLIFVESSRTYSFQFSAGHKDFSKTIIKTLVFFAHSIFSDLGVYSPLASSVPSHIKKIGTNSPAMETWLLFSLALLLLESGKWMWQPVSAMTRRMVLPETCSPVDVFMSVLFRYHTSFSYDV